MNASYDTASSVQVEVFPFEMKTWVPEEHEAELFGTGKK
jgi:hypothetical protein